MEQDAAAGGDLQAGSHHQAQYESGGDGAEHDSRGSRGSTPRTMNLRFYGNSTKDTALYQ